MYNRMPNAGMLHQISILILVMLVFSSCILAPGAKPSELTALPSPQINPTVPLATETSLPAITPTPIPTSVPTPTTVVFPEDGYDNWLIFTHPAYGFTFQYPSGWTVELDERQDSTSFQHLLWLKSPDDPLSVLSIGFKRSSENYGIQRTGVGSGEIIPRGAVFFLGEEIARDVLVAQDKDRSVLYNGAGEIRRGDLVFTIGLDFQGDYASPTALSGEVETSADAIVASFQLLD